MYDLTGNLSLSIGSSKNISRLLQINILHKLYAPLGPGPPRCATPVMGKSLCTSTSYNNASKAAMMIATCSKHCHFEKSHSVILQNSHILAIIIQPMYVCTLIRKKFLRVT